MHNGYCFKSTGNSLQFKFNAGVRDDIEDILDDQNLHEFDKDCRSFSGRMANYH